MTKLPLALVRAAERRAAHDLALVEPMVGCDFVGEPRIGRDDLHRPTPLEWYRCQYATALLRRRDPAFAGDLSRLRASMDMFGTVEFRTELRCRKTAANPTGLKWVVVATVTLPQPAAATRPATIEVALSDFRSGDRAAPQALPAPSPAPVTTAGQTEWTSP